MYGPSSVYTPPAAPPRPSPVKVLASQTQVPTEGPYAGGFFVLSCLVLSMSCCIVLCCNVLFCVVLCCSVLFCVVLCCVVSFCVVLCCLVSCCIVLFCVVLCCVVDGTNKHPLKGQPRGSLDVHKSILRF